MVDHVLDLGRGFFTVPADERDSARYGYVGLSDDAGRPLPFPPLPEGAFATLVAYELDQSGHPRGEGQPLGTGAVTGGASQPAGPVDLVAVRPSSPELRMWLRAYVADRLRGRGVQLALRVHPDIEPIQSSVENDDGPAAVATIGEGYLRITPANGDRPPLLALADDAGYQILRLQRDQGRYRPLPVDLVAVQLTIRSRRRRPLRGPGTMVTTRRREVPFDIGSGLLYLHAPDGVPDAVGLLPFGEFGGLEVDRINEAGLIDTLVRLQTRRPPALRDLPAGPDPLQHR